MKPFFDKEIFSSQEFRIFQRFPKLFRQASLSCQESCMYWGFEVPEEWFPYIERLAEQINEIAPDNVEFAQVKEKWGQLRVYVDFIGKIDENTINKVDNLINETEGIIARTFLR